MPEIARFYGVRITMYADDHNPPHFHAYADGREALFNINDGVFMKGSLASKEARLVLAWYELHKGELLENWSRISEGKAPVKISPLS